MFGQLPGENQRVPLDSLNVLSRFRVAILGEFGQGENNTIAGFEADHPLSNPGAGDEFPGVERLGNEIVGASPQPFHYPLRTIVAGHKNDIDVTRQVALAEPGGKVPVR